MTEEQRHRFPATSRKIFLSAADRTATPDTHPPTLYYPVRKTGSVHLMQACGSVRLAGELDTTFGSSRFAGQAVLNSFLVRRWLALNFGCSHHFCFSQRACGVQLSKSNHSQRNFARRLCETFLAICGHLTRTWQLACPEHPLLCG